MQDLAHVIVNDVKWYVFRVKTQNGVALKRRIAGEDGQFLENESKVLQSDCRTFNLLLQGRIVEMQNTSHKKANC